MARLLMIRIHGEGSCSLHGSQSEKTQEMFSKGMSLEFSFFSQGSVSSKFHYLPGNHSFTTHTFGGTLHIQTVAFFQIENYSVHMSSVEDRGQR